MGTTDVSIIEIAMVDGEYQFEVLSTAGDGFLGGANIDSAITDWLITEFKKESGIDVTNDSMALQRLKESAEKAKIELSSNLQTDINLPYLTADATGPKHLNVKLTRARLESLIADVLERIKTPCLDAIKESGKRLSEIDEVILVGGSTRMPCIQNVIKDIFGKEPRKDINPDEAVALGAAIQGGVLSGDVTDVLLLDVIPLSLGIETMGGVMTKLVERNTTIPTNATQVFSTAMDNQDACTIHVIQGERQKASANKSLGQFNLTDIPPAPRGVPQIEVSFDIDANGILNVTAKDKGTGVSQKIVISASSGLSDEEIDRMVKDAEAHAEEDKKLAELVAIRNQAEQVIIGIESENQELSPLVKVKIDELKEAINSDDSNKIQSLMKELLDTVAENKNETTNENQSNDDVIDV